MSIKKTLLCYHFGCTDGTIAAYNFYRNVKNERYDVTYHAVGYQDGADLGRKENDLDEYDQIIFVDFCPSAAILRTLLENESRDVIILDHHATAKAVVAEFFPNPPHNLFFLIVDQLSGAGLVHSLDTDLGVLWIESTSDEIRDFEVDFDCKVNGEKFNTVSGITNIDGIEWHINPDRMDRLTLYVCSRDLWLCDHNHTKGNFLDCYFKVHGIHNKHPSQLEFLTNESDGISRCVVSGEAYMQFMEKTCAKQIEKSLQRVIKYRGNELRIIIGITDTGFTSTFGEAGYSKDEIPTVVVGITPNFVTNTHGISIRSSKELNVTRYAAEMFSGGGHRNASGGRWFCEAINAEQIMQNTLDLLDQIGDLFD